MTRAAKALLAAFLTLTLALAPMGSMSVAWAEETGSFSIQEPWFITEDRAPLLHLSFSPPSGMTRVAYLVGPAVVSTPLFPDRAFGPLSSSVTVQTPDILKGYEGQIKVWVQFADSSGRRSPLLLKDVSAYADSHTPVTDEAGNSLDTLLTDPQGKDLPVRIAFRLGNYGQGVPNQSGWTIRIYAPDGTATEGAVDPSTGVAHLVIPGALLTKAQTLRVQIMHGGQEVRYRSLSIRDASQYGVIRVRSTGTRGDIVAWLAATKQWSAYTNDFTLLPATIAVPPGTYRVEGHLLNQGLDDWLLYPSGTVKVEAGQYVDAPVLDATKSVPLQVTNTAKVDGAPLKRLDLQFSPTSWESRTALTVYTPSDSSQRRRDLYITPGTYHVLFALQKSDTPDGHAYFVMQNDVDVAKGVTVSDDFSNTTRFGTLRLSGTDAQGRPANVMFHYNTMFTYGWGPEGTGEAVIMARRGPHYSWVRVGPENQEGRPYFWEYEKWDVRTDSSLAIGGALTAQVTGAGVEPGQSATVTVAVKDQYGHTVRLSDTPLVTLAIRDMAGHNVATLTQGKIGDNKMSVPAGTSLPLRVIATLDLGKYGSPITAETVFGAPTFTDLDQVLWAKADVELMAAQGVVKGVGSGQFGPMGTVTRAQFATFLVRALGLGPKPTAGRFQDVKAEAWYDGNLGAALEAGLIKAGGDFMPEGLITREDMAVMLARGLEYKQKGQTLTADDVTAALSAFSDAADVTADAHADIAQVVKAGLMKGRDGGRIAPRDTATRAEAIVIIKRLLTYTGDI